MSLRTALRSRLLRAACSVAVVALLAVPAVPGAAAADDVPAPATTETAEPTPEPPSETRPETRPESVPEPATPQAVTPEPTPEPAAGTTPQPVPAGPACRGGALGTGPLAGVVDPRDGSRWVATVAAPGRLLLSRAPSDGTTTPPLATVDLPGAPGTAGGLAFGTDGRLHVVAAADGGGDAVLYRTALPLRPGARPVVADEVSRTRSDGPLTRIAFDRAGLLHLVQDGSSTAVDPVTGEPVATYDAAAGQRLACGRPGRLTVRVDLPRGRAGSEGSGDQLAVTLTGGAYDGPVTPPTGVTAGADSGVQARRGEYVQVVTRPGATHEVALTTADGAAPTAYDVTLACLDGTAGVLATEAVGAAGGSLTLPAESAAVTCTFTAVPVASGGPAAAPRARGLRPTVRSMSADGPLGGGIGTDRQPGGGAGKQPERDPAGADEKDDAAPGGGADLGRDLGAQMRQDGALGAGGGLGGAMPGMSDPEAGVQQPQQPRTTADRGPNLPNTGGPPAVVLPIALGAIVLGAVLVARRRPAPGRHRG